MWRLLLRVTISRRRVRAWKDWNPCDPCACRAVENQPTLWSVRIHGLRGMSRTPICRNFASSNPAMDSPRFAEPFCLPEPITMEYCIILLNPVLHRQKMLGLKYLPKPAQPLHPGAESVRPSPSARTISGTPRETRARQWFQPGRHFLTAPAESGDMRGRCLSPLVAYLVEVLRRYLGIK